MSTTRKLPVLYSFRRCPYAMRARMALMQAGVQCELREVDLKDKPAELLAISPKGTVPVLQLIDGTVIDESFDVMVWALEQSNPDGWGMQLDAEVEQVFFSEFRAAVSRFKYPERFADEGGTQQSYRDRVEHYLSMLDQRLQQSTYVCGEVASINDLVIFPFVRQCRLVDADWFDALPYLALLRWLNAWLSSTCYEQAMKRVEPWRPNQDVVLLP